MYDLADRSALFVEGILLYFGFLSLETALSLLVSLGTVASIPSL